MSARSAPGREALAAALGLGTALRGGRVFHPRGQAYACRLVVRPTGRARGSALLDTAAEHEGVVRLVPTPLLRTLRARSYDALQAARA